jgi:hypothetical protein
MDNMTAFFSERKRGKRKKEKDNLLMSTKCLNILTAFEGLDIKLYTVTI